MASPQQSVCRVVGSGQGGRGCRRSNKQRFSEGEELAINSSAANQVPVASALYARAHRS